jgi:protein TonB
VRRKPSPDRPDSAIRGGVRTILVPPDIVAVKRTSPLPQRKRTPLRLRPEGAVTERAGGREWFSDRLFVEAQQENIRTACGTSITAHASGVILVIVGLLAQSDLPPIVRAGPRLVMPAMVAATLPDVSVAAPASRANLQPPPKMERRTDTPPPPPPPLAAGAVPPAPLEAPSSIEPESGAESGADGSVNGSDAGDRDGVDGGVPGGVVGGVVGGTLSSGSGTSRPMRVGGGIEPPRKIKDVRPIYPQNALTDQSRGTVLIEAIIGTDGKVQDAKVLHSVPLLDQAALDAVRQWEFLPSRLNGVPVAVIITVIVQFAIH